MPVRAADALHTNHYACMSSQQFKKLATAGQAPKASHRIPYVVQVPESLTAFSRQCRHPIVDMQILTLVQTSNNSHANPYACEGSQQC
ncbi:hypothetical protein O181_102481 [Austropuccinia psidii MF-1]|uniref:Uncharacterized protein n=1 Tax=Austropuccinia psidii MF-1 TaxID=1389203 RepID=A0A9Q3JIR8_9BASI|nr:hypothetical protein [Austropuccinia psidii MF-1]